MSSKLLTEKCVFGGEYEEEQLTKNIRLEYWLYFFLVLFHMHFCEKKWGVTTYPGLGQVVTQLGASCHITSCCHECMEGKSQIGYK